MKKFPSIKKNDDYKTVYKKGRSLANSLIVVYILKNGQAENRIGISVSKKVGNSIVRHRLTRLVREAFRLNNDSLQQGYDLVVVLRDAAKGLGFEEINQAFISLCRRHNILI